MVSQEAIKLENSKKIAHSRARTRKYCRAINKCLFGIMALLEEVNDPILAEAYNNIQTSIANIEHLTKPEAYKSATDAIENTNKKIDLIMDIDEELTQLELMGHINIVKHVEQFNNPSETEKKLPVIA